MPLNRYGGYGGYGGSYSNYTSSYSSSYGRAGSASPATLRAATPSRAFGSNSIINTILPEDRAFKLSSYSSYSPTTYSRIYLNDYEKRDLKTIKTEELETSVENRENTRNHAIPGEITRDTTLNIRGGKPVVRIVTQKAKENPYINNPGWRNRVKEEEEKNSLTLGQRLALKHQIAEKPKPSESSSQAESKTKKTSGDSGEESEWTWETCSSSSQEDDGYEYTVVNNKTKVKTPPPPPPSGARRPPVVYSKSNTTTLCSTEDSKSIKQSPSTPATPNSAVRNRWLESLADPKPKASPQAERIPNFGSSVSASKHLLGRQVSRESEKAGGGSARPVSWAGLKADIQTTKPASSSGSSSSSPPLYKYIPSKARPRPLLSSSDEEEGVGLGPGWRPGQPPRGEVVVKLTNNKAKPVIDSQHSNKAKLTNQALTSDTVISSKVPGNMNEKYSIPGLFIKPSTKEAPKSVEAKLTLSPVEGTFSLTTKVKDEKEKGSYQSAIFTPSKSPLLDSRTPPSRGAPDEKHLSAPVSKVCLSSVVETAAGTKSEEESEWEYYTETEPSDTEQEKKESQTSPVSTKTEKADDSKTKESVLPPDTKYSAQKSNNVLSVPANSSLQTQPKPCPEKPPLEIKTVEKTENKAPVATRTNVEVNKSLAETKTIPATNKPQARLESDNNLSNKTGMKHTNSNLTGHAGQRSVSVAESSESGVAIKLQSQTRNLDNTRQTELKIEQNKEVDTNKHKPFTSQQKTSKSTEKDSSDLRLPADSSKKHDSKTGLDIKTDAVANSKKVKTTEDQTEKSIPAPEKKINEKITNSNKLITTSEKNEGHVKEPEKKTTEKIQSSNKLTTIEKEKTRNAPGPAKKIYEKVVPTLEEKEKNVPVPEKKNIDKVTISNKVEEQKPKSIPAPAQKNNDKVVPKEEQKIKIVPAPDKITNVKVVPKAEGKVENVPGPAHKINEKVVPPEEKRVEQKVLSKAEEKVKNVPGPAHKNYEKVVPSEEQKEKSVPEKVDKMVTGLGKEKDFNTESRTSSPENNMPATSLERLPSNLKNMFSGTVTPRSSPENAPKWYNNTPKEDPNHISPTKAISQMKNDVNKQVEKQIKQEQTLIKISDKADNPWYNEEDDDMKDLLQKRPSILKEIDLSQDRRLTPEENMAVIKMYGGIMFPGGLMEKTPKSLLFKIRKTGRGRPEVRDSGFDSQPTSARTNSTGSNSSTISSKLTVSESVL